MVFSDGRLVGLHNHFAAIRVHMKGSQNQNQTRERLKIAKVVNSARKKICQLTLASC